MTKNIKQIWVKYKNQKKLLEENCRTEFWQHTKLSLQLSVSNKPVQLDMS